jgi:predicted PurR-regulated permease PerM
LTAERRRSPGKQARLLLEARGAKSGVEVGKMAQDEGDWGPLSAERPWLWRWGISSWLILGISGLVVVAGMALSRAHQVVIPLIIAFILGILLKPFVEFLMGWHFPRWLAVIVVIALVLALFAGFLTVIVYGVTTQAGTISRQVKSGVTRLQDWFNHLKVSKSVLDWVDQSVRRAWPNIGGGLARAVTRSVSGLASFAIGLFIGFFILLFLLSDDGAIEEWAVGHMGVSHQQGESILAEVTASIRGYFKGATIVAAVNALVIIPVTLILRVPLVGAISLVTFVTCYIPSFGGYIGGAFAVFIALASRGLTAGLVMLAFVIVAHTLLQTPVQAFAYGKTLKLHPLVALLVTLLGIVFGGIAGAILAVPLTAVVLKVTRELKRARASEAPDGEPALTEGGPPPTPEAG